MPLSATTEILFYHEISKAGISIQKTVCIILQLILNFCGLREVTFCHCSNIFMWKNLALSRLKTSKMPRNALHKVQKNPKLDVHVQ